MNKSIRWSYGKSPNIRKEDRLLLYIPDTNESSLDYLTPTPPERMAPLMPSPPLPSRSLLYYENIKLDNDQININVLFKALVNSGNILYLKANKREKQLNKLILKVKKNKNKKPLEILEILELQEEYISIRDEAKEIFIQANILSIKHPHLRQNDVIHKLKMILEMNTWTMLYKLSRKYKYPKSSSVILLRTRMRQRPMHYK